MGKRWQLVDHVLFCDVKNTETGEKFPEQIQSPHIFDQREQLQDPNKPATYLKLNDGAAYIARFIVIGVDTDLIAQIIKSEYGPAIADPAAEVQAVVNILQPYLEPRGTRNIKRNYEKPDYLEGGKKDYNFVDKVTGKPLKGYEIDFRVNWIPSSCCKVPIG